MSASPSRARNPYRPGAAVTPLYLAGRTKAISRFRNTLASSPELPANIKLTGLRGVGKTVLLKEFDRTAREDLGWLTSRVQIEPRHNRDDAITALIADLGRKAVLQASRAARLRARVGDLVTAARGLITVTYEDLELTFGAPPPGTDSLAEALFNAAKAADDNGYEGYLLMLDEAQLLRDDKDASGQHPLSVLVAAVNTLQEAEIPVALVMCGLPTLKANLLKARTYSERMFRGEEIGSLAGPPGSSDAVEAFVKPLEGTGVRATDELIAGVISEVEGYPFFIQLWGAELWDAAAEAGVTELDEVLLQAVQPDIYERLDNDFYGTRVDSLTPAEADLLMATARCSYPPLRTADIRSRSSKTDNNVNVLMGRLAEQGVVYRIQKGAYEYTAPRFHEYLQRRAAKLAVRNDKP